MGTAVHISIVCCFAYYFFRVDGKVSEENNQDENNTVFPGPALHLTSAFLSHSRASFFSPPSPLFTPYLNKIWYIILHAA